LMFRYYELVTDISMDEIEQMDAQIKSGSYHPMDAKKRLARLVVETYYTKEDSIYAEKRFETIHQKRDYEKIECIEPTVIRVKKADFPGVARLVNLMKTSGIVESTSQARRLIQQGGVKVNGTCMNDIHTVVEVNDPLSIQVGKRYFAHIEFV
jgi:tyrosyl-tRNA synthetase